MGARSCGRDAYVYRYLYRGTNANFNKKEAFLEAKELECVDGALATMTFAEILGSWEPQQRFNLDN